MKACVVQPEYSFDYNDSERLYQWEMEMMDRCDESMDIIVFPEYSNVPALARTKDQVELSYEKYNDLLMKKASETALRCNAVLFINGMYMTEKGLRNTTVAFGRDGKEAGVYFKQHLVPKEMEGYELDKDYTYEFSEPTILTIDGIRYGFLICYDFYFYESFSNIARYNPDVIIVCSHQRSDTHDALRTMCKFCAYNCNAYLLRSSVSLGEQSEVGGSSMIVEPDGNVLVDLRNEVGFGVADIDPHKRYLKPAGFGNAPDVHHNYVERGRRPWKYRPGGSAIVCPDDVMPYPRICAHRGFNTIAPENSMPAFGAAVAMGAEEIEFDLWWTKDEEVVSIHDSRLDRVSDGSGYVWDYTYEELLKFDFGSKFSDEYAGLKIVKFEEILAKFSCHTIMNIHIKSRDNENPLSETYLKKIVDLIKKYDCEKHCYFMSGNETLLIQLRELAPHIARCAGAGDDACGDLVEKAIRTGACKIQLFRPYFKKNPEDYFEKAVEKAHANGIRVNVFWSDNPERTKRYLELGADTILTNDYHRNAILQGKNSYGTT
jgi:glycerophosphoryl diester phosphodiesterase